MIALRFFEQRKGSWFIPAAFSYSISDRSQLLSSGYMAGLLVSLTFTFLPTQGHSVKNQ